MNLWGQISGYARKVAGADGKGCGRKRQKNIFMGETTHTDCSDFYRESHKSELETATLNKTMLTAQY